MPKSGPTLIQISLPLALALACSNHEVDTADEWCEQITGVDLYEKYAPFWAVLPSVSFSGEAIRDDFVANLNQALMEKVDGRADRMAWRDGTQLHIENLSSLFEVDPQEIIGEWRAGIDRANRFETLDLADECLFGSVVSLFDGVKIHSFEQGEFHLSPGTTTVTELDTERRERLPDAI